MFKGLKKRRRVRRENRARKLLGIEYCGDLEVLRLPQTGTIIFFKRYNNYRWVDIVWRGTWLPPQNEQVLEIRRMELDCKNYNQLLTYGELREFSVDGAVNYIGEMGVISIHDRKDRACVRVIVNWFREEVGK